MSSESALQTSKEQLTAQQKITEDDGAKRMKLVEKLQSDFQVERNELNSKLQELLMHNRNPKMSALKKRLCTERSTVTIRIRSSKPIRRFKFSCREWLRTKLRLSELQLVLTRNRWKNIEINPLKLF